MTPHFDKAAFMRPPKDALLRARCSRSLLERLQRMALVLDKDVSVILREAALDKLNRFEQQSA